MRRRELALPTFGSLLGVQQGVSAAPWAVAATASGSQGASSEAGGLFDVTRYGARGDGRTDDTIAIERTFQAATDAVRGSLAPESTLPWLVTRGSIVYFPPGNFLYSGAGLRSDGTTVWSIIGAGSAHSRITLTDRNSFVSDSRWTGGSFTGLHLVGGNRQFQLATSRNVDGQIKFVSDCIFSGYVEAGIDICAADFPRLVLERCLFVASSNRKGSVGVNLCGLTALTRITDCDFINNNYSMRLSPTESISHKHGIVGPATPLTVFGNSFIRYEAAEHKRYDVWIVPNPATWINAGRGIIFHSNKFGNEHLAVDEHRFLIADSDERISGFGHSEDLSLGYIEGLSLCDNNVAFSGVGQCSYIYSYTPNLSTVLVDDVVDGVPRYFVEYDRSAVEALRGTQYAIHRAVLQSNTVSLRRVLATKSLGLPLRVSNCNDLFDIIDPFSRASRVRRVAGRERSPADVRAVYGGLDREKEAGVQAEMSLNAGSPSADYHLLVSESMGPNAWGLNVAPPLTIAVGFELLVTLSIYREKSLDWRITGILQDRGDVIGGLWRPVLGGSYRLRIDISSLSGDDFSVRTARSFSMTWAGLE